MSKILVVDDDSTILLVLKKALQNQGHEIILATNGQEALELVERIQPALIICDWMMPLIDGLEVCRQIKANPGLATTFFILLTSRVGIEDRIQGLNTGADDFLAKPIDIGELQARVRAGLRLHQLSQDLQMQKQYMEAELAEAATYVQALLPTPMSGQLEIDARFLPSRQLGGDCFDYFWLDPDYLVLYLLDVSGHGLGAALPSILVLNVLRSQSLPNVNFYQPHDVLRALNETFPMSSQNEKYFTIWYGVYNRVKRQLTYASAGHPPAVLISSASMEPHHLEQLRTPSLPIGMLSEVVFTSDRQFIPQNSTLYIFSDGVYDFQTTDEDWGLHPFIKMLHELDPKTDLDIVLQHVQTRSGVKAFQDDLSLLRVNFN